MLSRSAQFPPVWVNVFELVRMKVCMKGREAGETILKKSMYGLSVRE